VLTDGYFLATVPEILVDPAYRRHGIGRQADAARRSVHAALMLTGYEVRWVDARLALQRNGVR
jgi:hypothetical protein